jgi:predicted nucleic acid-binding protein
MKWRWVSAISARWCYWDSLIAAAAVLAGCQTLCEKNTASILNELPQAHQT